MFILSWQVATGRPRKLIPSFSFLPACFNESTIIPALNSHALILYVEQAIVLTAGQCLS